MPPQRRILLTTLILAVITGFAWLLLRAPSGPPDPIYDGKPISYWTKQWVLVLKMPGGEIQILGIDEGRQISGSQLYRIPHHQFDSNAVPYLKKALQTRDAPFHDEYLKYFPKLPDWLRKRLPTPSDGPFIRQNVAYLLALTGAPSPDTIQALIVAARKDRDAHVRAAAIQSLQSIAQFVRHNPQVSQTLTALLKDQDADVRSAATNALRALDPAALPISNGDSK